jgi:ADP-dependent NAD(P)H-hydrate dehydratase / NAD(P)H-hydrate epimerase
VIGAWTVAEVRAAEEALMATLPDGALMVRAAHGLAVRCGRMLSRRYGARVALLVGAGNNGGDALYAGAVLARGGAHVTAILLAPDRAHRGGLGALLAAGGRTIDAAGSTAVTDAAGAAPAGRAIAAAELILDGIVGIGGSGELRAPAPALLAARDPGAVLVAVDVPSGVDSDTGAVAGAHVAADVTVTFGGHKPGLLLGAGAGAAGVVELVDIGLRPHLPEPGLRMLTRADVAAAVPVPGQDDDKYTRGVVGVAAGSTQYAGAALLATAAAARSPAGMVRYAGPAAALVQSRLPEVIASTAAPDKVGRVQAWVVGPGIGTDHAAEATLAAVLNAAVPVLVDADAITILARRKDLLRGRQAPTIVTPHDREFARLAGAGPGADRLGAARRAAADLGVVVLLKGDATIVASPDGSAYVDGASTPWLATGGSGDVLSGMVGGLLAAGVEPALAAAAGTHLHSAAGALAAERGVPTAADVLAAVPRAYAGVLGDGR